MLNTQRQNSEGRKIQHSALSVQRWTLGVVCGELSTSASLAFSFTPECSRQLIRFSSQATSTISNFYHGPSVLPSRFIFRGWKFSARLGLYFAFCIAALFRF